MKATWDETSDEESKGEEVENNNLALMTGSDSDTDEESSEESEDEREINLTQYSSEKVSAPAPTEGTIMTADSLNVPPGSGQELNNSRGTYPETVVVSTYQKARRGTIPVLCQARCATLSRWVKIPIPVQLGTEAPKLNPKS
ncbi:hypothetical protein HAX54_038970 [Datura stramonium]|uniref:Uncharacterized protein n=1 Tax=Datura stramonium TaxID=4076 RepID=A0ABS8SIT8_DATST|nr:hypothetical protein [Datura stramonium]